MAAIPPPGTLFTVVNAMAAFSLSSQDATMFSTDISMDNFQTCRYISNEYIGDSLQAFSNITVVQGQIRILPAYKQRVKNSNQWVKENFMLWINPKNIGFTVANTADILILVKNT